MLSRLAIFSFLIFNGQLFAQTTDSVPAIRILDINPRYVLHNDSVWIHSGICKTLKIERPAIRQSFPAHSQHAADNSFLNLHGNVQYDYLYRSLIDTPFYQKDFRQHTVTVNMNLMIKKQYPLQFTLRYRSNNSPYFSNTADVAVQFAQKDYLTVLKDQLYTRAEQLYKGNYKTILPQAELRFANKLSEVRALEQWLANPARIQEIMAEKERILQGTSYRQPGIPGELPSLRLPEYNSPDVPELPDADIIKKAIARKAQHIATSADDSLLAKVKALMLKVKKREEDSLFATKTAAYIQEQKDKLSKAKKELAEYEKKLEQIRKGISDSLMTLKQELASVKTPEELKKLALAKKADLGQLPKNWKFLSAINKAGIGRTWADYSELTVKNISLTGVNIEMNPGNFYFAVAAGNINYRFRDFISHKPDRIRQPLYLLRAGLGKKDGNHFIVSWYDGKRTLLNSFSSQDTIKRFERVIGVSAEARLKLNENQHIVVEFAKSSFSRPASGSGALLDRVKNFKDRSNEAFAVKISSYWPGAGARLSGYYRKSGENFQSFNLLPVNSRQEAYQLKYQQQLWNKKLLIDAGIRKNDFDNPFVTPGLSSHTVFKSLQLSLKVPKYPFLTIGFSPSSQFTVLDNRHIAENRYNTLNAAITYSYRSRRLAMMSNALFLKFYNKTSDTGFIYYNASTLTFNQFFFAGAWQFQSGLNVSGQKDLNVFTVEQSVTYQGKKWLSLSGGIKYCKTGKELQWGSSAGISIVMNKIGTIRINYDKSFLPGTNRDLLPVTMGRLGLFRSF